MKPLPSTSVLILAYGASASWPLEQKPIIPVHLRNTEDTTGGNCRCFPGDECWPSETRWSSLNATVGGRLIATVPLASPCHDPDYDEEQCAYLRDQWLYAGVQ